MKNIRAWSTKATIFIILAGLTFSVCSSAEESFKPTQAPILGQQEGNLVLALSVEWPTGNQQSYPMPVINRWWSAYDFYVEGNGKNKVNGKLVKAGDCIKANGDLLHEGLCNDMDKKAGGHTYDPKYYGIFDSRKCYRYDNYKELFIPVSGQYYDKGLYNVGQCPDDNHWSGNLLNFLTADNIDQIRIVLTGGTRDTFSPMALQKQEWMPKPVNQWDKFSSDRNFWWHGRNLKGQPKFTPGNPMTFNPINLQRRFASCTPMNDLPPNLKKAVAAIYDNFRACLDRADYGMTFLSKIYTYDEALAEGRRLIDEDPIATSAQKAQFRTQLENKFRTGSWRPSDGFNCYKGKCYYALHPKGYGPRIGVLQYPNETGRRSCGHGANCNDYFGKIFLRQGSRWDDHFRDRLVEMHEKGEEISVGAIKEYVEPAKLRYMGGVADINCEDDVYYDANGNKQYFNEKYDAAGNPIGGKLCQGNRYGLNNSVSTFQFGDRHNVAGFNYKYRYGYPTNVSQEDIQRCKDENVVEDDICERMGQERNPSLWPTGEELHKAGYLRQSKIDVKTYDDCKVEHDVYWGLQLAKCLEKATGDPEEALKCEQSYLMPEDIENDGSGITIDAWQTWLNNNPRGPRGSLIEESNIGIKAANWCDAERMQLYATCEKVFQRRISAIGDPLSCPNRCGFDPFTGNDPISQGVNKCADGDAEGDDTVLIRSYSDRWLTGDVMTRERMVFSAPGKYKIDGQWRELWATPGLPLRSNKEIDAANQLYSMAGYYFDMKYGGSLQKPKAPNVKVQKPVKVAAASGYGTKMVMLDWPNATKIAESYFPLRQRRLDHRNTEDAGAASCAEMMGDPRKIRRKDTNQWCFNIRVVACKSVDGVGPEEGCEPYKNSYFKPEGLMQEYSDRLRYGAAGYLLKPYPKVGFNVSVMRAPLKYIGNRTLSQTTRDPNTNKLTVTTTPNKDPEWDKEKGNIFPNPYETLAKNSNVTFSGVLNYLNQFGYTSGGYMDYDQAALLEETILRYYRDEDQQVDTVRDTIPLEHKDGFPVLTSSDLSDYDAIPDNCRDHFILGIGDLYSHDRPLFKYRDEADAYIKKVEELEKTAEKTALLPGIHAPSWWNNKQSPLEPTKIENINLSKGVEWAGRTKPIFGLSYWAKTNDMREAISKKYGGDEKQTINTYWIDVMERNNHIPNDRGLSFEQIVDSALKRKTQYWLAAKYGGFRNEYIPEGAANPNDPNSHPDAWDLNRDGVPDNFFAGNSPEKLRESLTQAFEDISYRAASLNTAQPAQGTAMVQSSTGTDVIKQFISYHGGYNPRFWSGFVIACLTGATAEQCLANQKGTVAITDANGNITEEIAYPRLWDARQQFASQYDETTQRYTEPRTKPDARKIITSWKGAGMPFRYANLLPEQRYVIDDSYRCGDNSQHAPLPMAVCHVGQERLDYIRGVRDNEQTLFRARNSILGDIINSGLQYVAAPDSGYLRKDENQGASGAPAPGSNVADINAKYCGYDVYAEKNKDRKPIIYVGSNDGMLHAFDARVDINTINDPLDSTTHYGKEIFAYIPGGAYQIGYPAEKNPFAQGSNMKSGLLHYTDKRYRHRYLMDVQPFYGDLQKNLMQCQGTAEDWATILVGGYGAGGKGYYALDITHQDDFDGMSEAQLASNVLWEFTDQDNPRVGYSYYQAPFDQETGAYLQISKLEWGNGDHWAVLLGNGYGSKEGRAVLFILDPMTGSVLKELPTDSVNAGYNGLSAPTAVDTDADGLMDTIYAGDLEGKLHKFAAVNGDWQYQGVVFEAQYEKDGKMYPEQIVTSPTLAPRRCNDPNGVVLGFGSGSILVHDDIYDLTPRHFYIIHDKDGRNKVSETLSMENLSKIEFHDQGPDIRNGKQVFANTRKWTRPHTSADNKGFYMEFNYGERMVTNASWPNAGGKIIDAFDFYTFNPLGSGCGSLANGHVMSVRFCTGMPDTFYRGGFKVTGGASYVSAAAGAANRYQLMFDPETGDATGTSTGTTPPAKALETMVFKGPDKNAGVVKDLDLTNPESRKNPILQALDNTMDVAGNAGGSIVRMYGASGDGLGSSTRISIRELYIPAELYPQP